MLKANTLIVRKFFKYKKSLFVLGLTAITSAAVLASSCAAQPSASSVNNLFVPGNRFGDDKVGLSVNSLVTSVLSQTDAFNVFLDTVMGNVLLSFYQNNPIQSFKDQYNDWKTEVDRMWDNEVQNMKNQHRNNYLLNLQIGPLDNAGGTEQSWKQNELLKKALVAFKNSIFTKTYLNLTDASGNVISNPSPAQLTDKNNWPRIKYTNQHDNTKYVDNSTDRLTNLKNNEQMYADIQDFVATQWVKEENPNLLSRVVLTNETPKLGFNSIFNSQLNSSISASYEFQVFNPYNPLDISKTPANSWHELVGGANGLNKYLDVSNSSTTKDNGTIDFPTYLSSDSGGKLLMSAYDMFDSYDPLFSAAYVNQYLNLLDTSYATSYLPTAQVIKPEENIMNLFIRKNSGSEKGARALSYVGQKETGDTRSLFASNAGTIANGAYKNYVDLEPTTSGTGKQTTNQTSIFDVGFQKMEASGGTSKTETTNNQFLLSRGADGVHIIGIDGGSYYINTTSTSKTRDIAKQKEFLLFRTLYKQLGFAKKDYDYTFDATSQIQTFFNKNSSLYLYQAFSAALADSNSFLNLKSNASLKTSFEKAKNAIDSYVQAMSKSIILNKIETALSGMTNKFLSRAETYVTNEKDKNSAKNGIAGWIPNQQASDGTIPTLDFYYQQLAFENGISKSANGSNAPIIDTNGTRSYFLDLHNEVSSQLETSVNNFVTSLNLTIEASPTFSQIILIKSNADASYTLPINLALVKGIPNKNVTDKIKSNFFKNNQSFSNFYDFTTGDIKFTSSVANADSFIATKIKEIANYYYAEKLLNTSTTSKFSYGVPNTNTTSPSPAPNQAQQSTTEFTSYKNVLTNVLNSENFVKNSSSENAINYFTYLYTFEWLIRDNLQNLKSILTSLIPSGTSALVSWTVPVAVGTSVSDLDSKNPITTFPNNPNYYWGSSSNWLNSVNSPAKEDQSNKLERPYAATFDISGTGNSALTYSNIKYGFAGLTTEGSTKADAALSQTLYANFAKSKQTSETVSTGALYQFGSSRQEVVNFVNDNLNTNQDLNNFIKFLIQNVGITVTDSKLNETNTDISSKKTALVSLINNTSTIPDVAFNRYSGYIGNAKSTSSLKDSNPITSADGTQLLPTFVTQVNYNDVQKLGNGWLLNGTNTNNEQRLGLNLNEFLAVVAMQALDAGTQSSALTNLINTNVRDGTETTGPTLVGDKRLLDALTSRWAAAINQPKR